MRLRWLLKNVLPEPLTVYFHLHLHAIPLACDDDVAHSATCARCSGGVIRLIAVSVAVPETVKTRYVDAIVEVPCPNGGGLVLVLDGVGHGYEAHSLFGVMCQGGASTSLPRVKPHKPGEILE